MLMRVSKNATSGTFGLKPSADRALRTSCFFAPESYIASSFFSFLSSDQT